MNYIDPRKARNNANWKALRRRRFEQGLCTQCGEMRQDHSARLCTACQNKFRARWHANLKGKDQQYFADIKRKFGVDRDTYDAILLKQGGGCAICKMPPVVDGRNKRLAVDHNHQTGEFRGLLCTPCNTMLGRFGDDPALFAQVIAYLLGAPQVEASHAVPDSNG